MSDEYIPLEQHKQIQNETFIRGMIVGELRRLSQVHQEPQTVWALNAVRLMLGDDVK
jgi:hypothetical protein